MELSDITTPALAYLGDSVLEVCVRTYLVAERGLSTSAHLNRASLDFVRAAAQSEAMGRIEPILTEAEYAHLDGLIQTAVDKFKDLIGPAFHEYLKGAAEWVPPHLDREAVPDGYRYKRATICFVMAAVRRAYDAGIHMRGVDFCCPPVVLTYRES